MNKGPWNCKTSANSSNIGFFFKVLFMLNPMFEMKYHLENDGRGKR